jgi:hypothetical protein
LLWRLVLILQGQIRTICTKLLTGPRPSTGSFIKMGCFASPVHDNSTATFRPPAAMRINDERPHCPQRTSTRSRMFRSNVRAACQAAVVGRHFPSPLPQPSRFARIGMPSRRLTLPSTGARRPLCLMSRVSRGLAQPFLTAQPSEFRCHAHREDLSHRSMPRPHYPNCDHFAAPNKRRVGPFVDI